MATKTVFDHRAGLVVVTFTLEDGTGALDGATVTNDSPRPVTLVIRDARDDGTVTMSVRAQSTDTLKGAALNNVRARAMRYYQQREARGVPDLSNVVAVSLTHG
jgi:hypothetical protein